jgi:hypothetical protein
LGDIQHLEIALRVNRDWVRRGTAIPARLEGAHHNVSITVSVEDWDAVREYLWENRQYFTGVSLLSKSGDYDYEQAPLQAVYDDPDPSDPHYLKKVEIRDLYYKLLDSERKVDFSLFKEDEDNTTLNEAGGACSGGSCELEYYEKKLTRWDSQEEVSVVVSPSGYIVNARSEFGHLTNLTEEEERLILRRLKLDDDDCY